MEIDKTVSIVIAIFGAIVSLATFIGGYFAFKKIITNDLRHVDLNLNEIKDGMNTINKKLETHSEQIIQIATRLEERTIKRNRSLKKK